MPNTVRVMPGYKSGYQQALADVLILIGEAQSMAAAHGKGAYALHLQHIRALVKARMRQIKKT